MPSVSRNLEIPNEQRVPFNVSAVYTPHFQETLVNGVLQGRKQLDPNGASILCRKRTWNAVAEVISLMGSTPLQDMISEGGTYLTIKNLSNDDDDAFLGRRAAVKKDAIALALRGWVPNDVDDFSV